MKLIELPTNPTFIYNEICFVFLSVCVAVILFYVIFASMFSTYLAQHVGNLLKKRTTKEQLENLRITLFLKLNLTKKKQRKEKEMIIFFRL